MNARATWAFLAAILTLACAASPPAPGAAGPARYTVTDVGTLGGATSEAFGLSASGQVVGQSETADGRRHAFLYFPAGYQIRATGAYVPRRNGRPALLDLTPGLAGNSKASAINRFNVVAGSADTVTGPRAATWNGFFEKMLGPNEAFCINGRGQVGGVGTIWQADSGNSQRLAPAGSGAVFYAYGISDTGDVVGGELFDTTHGTTRPFLRRKTGYETLAQPAAKGSSAAAYAINESGQIVGTNGHEAFLWQGGKITWLAAAVRASVAYAINDAGEIVGQADVSWRDQSLRAVLWEHGEMIDLNTRIPAASGWTLIEARGINAQGQICGTGVIGGRRHAFLLTPAARPVARAVAK